MTYLQEALERGWSLKDIHETALADMLNLVQMRDAAAALGPQNVRRAEEYARAAAHAFNETRKQKEGTHAFHIDAKRRTQMARKLAKVIKDRTGVELKHSHCIAAIAEMLGLNEHSLAALIKKGEAPQLLVEHDEDEEVGE